MWSDRTSLIIKVWVTMTFVYYYSSNPFVTWTWSLHFQRDSVGKGSVKEVTFPGIAQGSTATGRGKPHTVGSGVHVFQLKGHIIFSCSWTPSFFWRMDVRSFETLYVRFWTGVWKQTAVGRETPTSGGVCSLEDLGVRGPEFPAPVPGDQSTTICKSSSRGTLMPMASDITHMYN